MSGVTGLVGKLLGYMLIIPSIFMIFDLTFYLLDGGVIWAILGYVPIIFLLIVSWSFTTMKDGFFGVYDTECIWIPFIGHLDFDLSEEEKEEKGYYIN